MVGEIILATGSFEITIRLVVHALQNFNLQILECLPRPFS